MNTAAILFAIAAVVGVTMAVMRFSGRGLPSIALAAVHGVFAAAGVVILVIRIMGNVVSDLIVASLSGFILAALGGFTLFLSFHLKKRALPIPLMLVHAAVALISFVLLLAVIFK